MLKRLLPALFFLSFSTLLMVFLSGCGEHPEVEIFNEAERLLSEGQYLAAIENYNRVFDSFPESPYAPRSQYKIGLIYSLYLSDFQKAMKAYSTLFYMYPVSPEVVLARMDRARVFTSLGDHWNAIEEYQWLMENGPADRRDRFQYNIAVEYLKMNDFGQARVELMELLSSMPSTPLAPECNYQLANIYYLEGYLEEAIEAYDEVISKFQGHWVSLEAKLGKATVLEEAGRLKEALRVLKELEDEYPNREAVKIRIASTEERLKKGPRTRKKR
jgi:TolA-binding protein